MTTVGALSSDLGPGNELVGKSSLDLPPSPTQSVPFTIATATDEEQAKEAASMADLPIQFLQASSKLDMEPNPFEQSFSGMSEDKAGGAQGHPGPAATEAPKPVLPPIASMSGRLGPNSEQYGWDQQSLRMGPLSPSMLEGPQNPINAVIQNPVPVGSFPSVTAPITTMFSSGPTVVAPQAPLLTDGGFPFVGQPSEQYPPMYSQAPPMSQQHAHHPQQQPMAAPHHAGARPPQHFTNQPPMNDRYMPAQGQGHPESGHPYGNLHLLTQATHREMWVKRESGDANNGGLAGYPPPQPQHHQQHPDAHQHSLQHSGQQQAGTAPGRAHPPPPADAHFNSTATKGKNSGDSGSAARRRQRSRLTSEDNSDDSEQSMLSSENGTANNKKRVASDDKMDEEEKRKNFLERNRQAALKCRQRKKQWLSNLQAKVEYLSTDNDHLQTQTAALRDEIIHLKALLLAHRDCPVAQANGVHAETINLPNNHGAVPPPHGRGPHSSAHTYAQQAPPQGRAGAGPRGGAMPQPPPGMRY